MNADPIPLFDYRQEYEALRVEIEAAIRGVLESGQLILGPHVQRFEEHLVRFLKCSGFAVGVGNGTDALAIALRAIGVSSGDEVITVANTAIPTVSAIRMVGAIPVFVDVAAESGLIDLQCIERRITPRTKVILPVHLYGNAVPMQPLLEIATRHSLRVIEDGAQALGAVQAGRAVGTMGDIGCFSFYPTKTLGAYGDGGLCFTRNAEFAESMRQLRMYGCGQTYYAEREGVCSRLDELQAAVLDVKLRHLEDALAARRAIARRYEAMLHSHIARPMTTEFTEHAYQLFVVRHDQRDACIERLRAEKIGFGIHYPWPIHLMTAYRFLGYQAGDLPVTEDLANRVLSLPCFPGLSEECVDRVCAVVNRT